MKSSVALAARTSVGAKAVMAGSGILLLLFVLGHMVGNLQVFAGPEKLNAYAAMLKGLGPGLWVVRLALLGVLVLHVAAAVVVTRRNRAARPVPYAAKRDLATTYAARTMLVSGVLVLVFVVYHLLHFTLGAYDPPGVFGRTDALGRVDVYGMVIAGFKHVPTTIAYVVAQLVLCLHIKHGASSLLQSLGTRRDRNRKFVDAVGPTFAAVVLVGNLSMPIAVAAGLIGR